MIFIDRRSIESESSKMNYDLFELEYLQYNKFDSLPLKEKIAIFNNGRPTPILQITSKNKNFVRHFHSNIYNDIAWICGCDKVSKLFCWPCLLYSSETNVWTKYGYCDLNNISQAYKRHETSQAHIAACVKLRKFKIYQDFQKSQENPDLTSDILHNHRVTAHRYILRKIIDVICFVSKKQILFKDHSKSRRGSNYVKLLRFLGDTDGELKLHLENYNMFEGPNNTVEANLVLAISIVLMQEIRNDIALADFVSIVFTKADTQFGKLQVSAVIRFINKNDIIVERFIGFTDINWNKTTEDMFNTAFKISNYFNCVDKLIAYSYDGSIVPREECNSLAPDIMAYLNNCLFMSYHSHRLHHVLAQIISRMDDCKSFVETLVTFSKFFTKFSAQIYDKNSKIRERFPSARNTQWKLDSKIIYRIIKHKKDILITLDLLLNKTEGQWDSIMIVSAVTLHYYLNNFDFNLHLYMFADVFKYARTLHKTLQNYYSDIKFCHQEIQKFKIFLHNKQKDFDFIWDVINRDEYESESYSRKRKISDPLEDRKSFYKRKYLNIIQILIKNIDYRFSTFRKTSFVLLLQGNKFREYAGNFPEKYFSSLRHSYRKHFDFAKLKSELKYIYQSPDFAKTKSLVLFVNLFKKYQMQDILPETYHLINLILTLPIMKPTNTNDYLTEYRIKSYIKKSHLKDRFLPSCLLAIENDFLYSLKKRENFYKKILDKFSTKEKKINIKFI